MKMIEIKCSEKTKRNIINVIRQSPNNCIFDDEEEISIFDCAKLTCNKCLKNNIKWIITSKNGSHTCEDCKYITFSNYENPCNTCKNFNNWRDSIE